MSNGVNPSPRAGGGGSLLDKVMHEGQADKENDQVRLMERRIHAEFIDDMCDTMEARGITACELAAAMGADPSLITRIRKPGNNLTLNTMARVMWLLGPENFRMAQGLIEGDGA